MKRYNLFRILRDSDQKMVEEQKATEYDGNLFAAKSSARAGKKQFKTEMVAEEITEGAAL